MTAAITTAYLQNAQYNYFHIQYVFTYFKTLVCANKTHGLSQKKHEQIQYKTPL